MGSRNTTIGAAGGLARALASIERRQAGGALPETGRLPSGHPALDSALGGGYPRGRIAEIFGSDASGKTALALLACASTQRAGGTAAFLDVEHALDERFARRLGADLRTLLLSRPRDGDEALSIAETLVRSNAVDLIVVDSAAALAPRREMARRLSESDDRAGAAMIAAGLRDLCGLLRRSRACLLFLNQTRSRPGPGTELSGEGTPGGRSIRLYAAARLEIERVRADAPPGNDPPVLSLRVRIVKHRASAKTRIARLDIPLGKA
ncbi:MAG: DNA recombination/repair protein RecA [Planctomycetota bacterium]